MCGTGQTAGIVLLPTSRRQPPKIDDSALLHPHVQNDPGDAVNASSIQNGTLFRAVVLDAAGKFHDTVMDLDTHCTVGNILVSFEFSENLLLNLRVIFHGSDLYYVGALRMQRLRLA
jgi:hypothetical protein